MIAPFPLEEYLAEEGPFECGFFAWMANLGKILIMDNLGSSISSWLIGVCVRRVEKLSTICYSIAS